MINENLYLKPINLIINEIELARTNGIFLIGEPGSGKTITLLKYIEKNKKTNNPVIDITLQSINSIEIYNDIAKLFQVCNILQKMLLYIKNNYLKCYVEHFLLFNTKIYNIQNDIVRMYNLNNYTLDTYIDKKLLNNPEILLEEFQDISLKYLKYDNLTVILDNFDVDKPYMYLYQTYMYNMLKKHLKVVATISDTSVINNQNKLNELSKENTLIMINYNRDIDVVKRILDKSLIKQKNIISKRVNFIFNDDTIRNLIVRSNGNLLIIILSVKSFFERIKEVFPLDYDKYLLSIVDEYQSLNSNLCDAKKVRKLFS